MSQSRPCRLSGDMMLLLRAALLSGEPAMGAWQAWRANVDLNNLDSASFTLLPLLHRNLAAMDIADAEMGRLAGVARSAWTSNQLLFQAGAAALTAFHDAGVDALVADATALALLHHDEGVQRRLPCFETLVRLGDALRAMAVLADAGWQMDELRPPLTTVLEFRDGARFRCENGHALMLTWRLWAGGGLDVEAEAWAASREVTAGALRARVLSATDLLLRALAGSERWRDDSSLRWVADAWMAMRAADGIDWTRLVTQAERYGLCLPTFAALDCLRAEFGAPVPAETMRQLQASSASPLERTAWGTSGGKDVRRRSAVSLNRYTHLTRNRNWLHRAGAFPRYLQCIWNLRSVWEVPARALVKAVQTIGRRGSGT